MSKEASMRVLVFEKIILMGGVSLLVFAASALSQEVPEAAPAWVQVGSTGFSGGYGQVLVPQTGGFLIFRQYQANRKLELELYEIGEEGDLVLTRRKSWPAGRVEPPDFESGAAAVWDGGELVYVLLGAFEGYERSFFYVYNIRHDTWRRLADTPGWQGAGDALAYVHREEGDFLYAFVGQRTLQTKFLRYSVANDLWEEFQSPPDWVYTDDGAALVWVRDGYLYALQGSGFADMPTQSFARFRLPDGPWEALPPIPDPAGVNDGGSLAWDGGRYIYAISGGFDEKKKWKQEASGKGFFRFDLELKEWKVLLPLPCPIGKYTGNRLAIVGRFLYLWQGTPKSWECGGNGIWRLEIISE